LVLEVEPEDVALPPEPPPAAEEPLEEVTVPPEVDPVLSEPETIEVPVFVVAADVDVSVVTTVVCGAVALEVLSVEEAWAATSASSTAAQRNEVSE
jgi:hypothetical protein